MREQDLLPLHPYSREPFSDEKTKGASVVIQKDGEYKTVPIYHRGAELFMKLGSSFFALKKNGITSHKQWRWETITGTNYNETGPMSRLMRVD